MSALEAAMTTIAHPAAPARAIAADITDRAEVERAFAAMPGRQVRYMTDRIPMKRTGTLDEIAAMIELIVSPDCAFTTSFTFDLSGGRVTY